MPVFPIQASFSRGEISPRLWARADISHYPLALKECTNFTVMRQGGLTRRPGTRFINEVKDSTRKTRLIPFIFSTEQAYVLEFGHLYMRVYALGGIVTSGGSPVEIVTPYTEQQIFEIHYVQSADVLYLAHEAHAPRRVSRTSDTNWTISALVFKDGPYLDLESTGTTLTPAGTGHATPQMTGYTTPSGQVTATYTGDNAWRVFDRKKTDRVSVANGSSGHVTYDFGSGISKVVDSYWVTGSARISEDDGDMITQWVLQGSHDGTDWISLDTRDNETGWSGSETRFFTFDNKTAFRYYRLDFSGGGGTDAINSTMSELALGESGDTMPPFNIQASSTAGINGNLGWLPSDIGRTMRIRGADGRWRWLRITGYTSSTVVQVRLYGYPLPDTSPISAWQMGSFSDESGWPARVAFYQERLVWARTKTQPQTVWMSKSGVFDEYGTSQPLLDDDGVTATILSESVNEIQWIVEGGDLLIGTSAAVRSLGPGDSSSAFSPTNMMQRKQVAYVHRQVFWDNRLFELTEALVHQGYHFMLPPLGEASGVV